MVLWRGLVVLTALLLTGCTVESDVKRAEAVVVESTVIIGVEPIEGTDVGDKVKIKPIEAPDLRNNGESEERIAMREVINSVIVELGIAMREIDINEVIPNYGLNINDISVREYLIYEGEGTSIVLIKSNDIEKSLNLLTSSLCERGGAIGNKGDYVYYVEGTGIEELLTERIGE